MVLIRIRSSDGHQNEHFGKEVALLLVVVLFNKFIHTHAMMLTGGRKVQEENDKLPLGWWKDQTPLQDPPLGFWRDEKHSKYYIEESERRARADNKGIGSSDPKPPLPPSSRKKSPKKPALGRKPSENQPVPKHPIVDLYNAVVVDDKCKPLPVGGAPNQQALQAANQQCYAQLQAFLRLEAKFQKRCPGAHSPTSCRTDIDPESGQSRYFCHINYMKPAYCIGKPKEKLIPIISCAQEALQVYSETKERILSTRARSIRRLES